MSCERSLLFTFIGRRNAAGRIDETEKALDRAVTKDCRAMHHAGLRQVVERCVVGGEPIVPESHIAELPAPTDCELGLGEMREEEGEQRVALFLGQIEDARGKTRVHEKPSPAALNRANDGMYDWRIGCD